MSEDEQIIDSFEICITTDDDGKTTVTKSILVHDRYPPPIPFMNRMLLHSSSCPERTEARASEEESLQLMCVEMSNICRKQ